MRYSDAQGRIDKASSEAFEDRLLRNTGIVPAHSGVNTHPSQGEPDDGKNR